MNRFEAVNIPVGVCWTFFMCLLWKLHKIYMEGHICLINRTPVYLWLHKVVWTSHVPPVMEIEQKNILNVKTLVVRRNNSSVNSISLPLESL